MTTDTRVAIRSAADLVAVVPFLLGFHPTDSLVVVGAADGRLLFAARLDLPPPGTPQAVADAEAAHVAALVVRQGARLVTVLGYGPDDRTAEPVHRVAAGLAAAGVEVDELLRVADGRFWSYTCPDVRCCPPQGRPFDPSSSPAAAASVLAGQVTYPDRAALAAQLDPVGGDRAVGVAAAARAAERRLTALADANPDLPRALRRAGRVALRRAARRQRAGGVLTDDEVAWLGVLLVHQPNRDHAWAGLDSAGHHVPLWLDVARRVEPAYLPAPACLLAFAAWRAGDGVLARIAVQRALAADPGYPLATLVEQLIHHGVTASTVDDWLRQGAGS